MLPDRDGAWLFERLDRTREEISLDWSEIPGHGWKLEPLGMNFPDMSLDDFAGMGSWVRRVGDVQGRLRASRPGLWAFRFTNGREDLVPVVEGEDGFLEPRRRIFHDLPMKEFSQLGT